MSCLRSRLASGSLLVASGLAFSAVERSVDAQSASPRLPRFEVDRSWQWPPKLPNGWLVGVVSWVAVDRRDHV